jgi:hypothetical protein
MPLWTSNGHHRGKTKIVPNGDNPGTTQLGHTRLMAAHLIRVARAHNLPYFEAPTRGMTIDRIRAFLYRQVWLHWSARLDGTMTQPTGVQVRLKSG